MVSLTEEFDYCWAIFHPHFPHLEKPELHIRKMPGAWGCCGANGITLIPLLQDTQTDFVRHVIFHEMCHLVFPNHKREFYDLLKQFDPMQKEEDSKRQKRLYELERLIDEIETL